MKEPDYDSVFGPQRDDGSKQPMQPIEYVGEVIRFRSNAIIDRLFREGIIDLNQIALWQVPLADKEQFWQMLGYSVSGFGDLSFVRAKTIRKADRIAGKLYRENQPDE